MKRFHFRLEAVRILRQREEQAALEKYARLLQSHLATQERLNSIQRQLASAWLEGSSPEAQSPERRTQLDSHCDALEQLRAQAEADVAASSRNLGIAVKALLEARRQMEIIETCREQQWIKHRATMQIAEQKLLDELGQRASDPLPSAES